MGDVDVENPLDFQRKMADFIVCSFFWQI
jgi:hypothetical protein